MFLANMSGIDPVGRIGQLRIYDKIEKDNLYVVAWDPSLGTGGDPAAIEVFRLPDLVQIAEWQHNKTDIRGQLRMLISILEHIRESGVENDQIYWSVEYLMI